MWCQILSQKVDIFKKINLNPSCSNFFVSEYFLFTQRHQIWIISEEFCHAGRYPGGDWLSDLRFKKIKRKLEFDMIAGNSSNGFTHYPHAFFSGQCTMLWWLRQSRAHPTIFYDCLNSSPCNSDTRFGESLPSNTDTNSQTWWSSNVTVGALSIPPNHLQGVSVQRTVVTCVISDVSEVYCERVFVRVYWL